MSCLAWLSTGWRAPTRRDSIRRGRSEMSSHSIASAGSVTSGALARAAPERSKRALSSLDSSPASAFTRRDPTRAGLWSVRLSLASRSRAAARLPSCAGERALWQVGFRWHLDACEQFVEQGDGGVRVDGGAGSQGLLPAGLEGVFELGAHGVGDVGVDAAHAGDAVAEAAGLEDFADAVFGHPGFVAVAQAVRGEAGPDRQPAGQRSLIGDARDAAAAWWREAGSRWRGRPCGDWPAGPLGGVDGHQPAGPSFVWLVAAVGGGAEEPPGVVAAPVMAAFGAKEHVLAAAAVALGAAAPLRWVGGEMAGQQLGEERGEVDGDMGFPVRAAV